MSNVLTRLITSLLLISLTACASKTPPRSTTTTRTQKETTNDTGDKTTSDTKETTVEQSDGSHTVKREETTNTTVPSPGSSTKK
jgi:predicted small lipoprotein YifL